MPLKVRTIQTALRRKGFEERQGSHYFYHLYVDGKKTRVHTMVSHGDREIGDKLIKDMSKELMLPKAEFLRLVKCSLSGEEYVAFLRAEGKIA